MSSRGNHPWKRFWSYVGYGVGACIVLALPLIAIDWLFKNLPLLDRLLPHLRATDRPLLVGSLMLAGTLLALGLMGWVVRRFLWDALCKAPVLGTLLTSGQQLANAVSHLDAESRRLVVWVQLLRYRCLGIITSRTCDEDGTWYASVYMVSGSGQFQGNQMYSVKETDLIYPGWTVDDAIVFSSSGGAVVPASKQESPAGA